MKNIQQWWLVSYGDDFVQRWIFEAREDAYAFALETRGTVDPVPVSLASVVPDLRESAARLATGVDNTTATGAQAIEAMRQWVQS